MKNFWLFLILSAAAGTAVAWTTNYVKFSRYPGRFGKMTMDGSINADNVMEALTKEHLTKRPKVEMVTETSHDFGVMEPDEEGSHVFIIRNAGDDVLNLKVGASTCKCTLGDLKSDKLEPGEQTEVNVSWTVKTKLKSFSQSAQIITNDPTMVAIDLSIHGRVVRQLEAEPSEWTFGDIAAGDEFEVSGKIYSYYENDIIPAEKMRFTLDAMTELAEFDVQPFEPGEDDGLHAEARQGFNIVAKIKPGLRQGAVSTNFAFAFQETDNDGNIVPPGEGDDDPYDYKFIEVHGRVVGKLSMIVGSKLKGNSGGGYTYDFGTLGHDDSKKARVFIVLKGSERDSTKLNIGEINPAGAIKATLGKPVKRETTVLYPLELEIVPGEKPIDLRGMNKDDYGILWIESDNPKVTKMLIAVKFAVDAKP